MITFICGVLVGAAVSIAILGAWLSPIIDEQKLLVKKLELDLKYAEGDK